MRRRCAAFDLTINLLLGVLLAPAADAAQVPADLDDHLVYGTVCGPDDAIRVEIDATPKGPKVTVSRGGAEPGPYATLDVNFAHVSRRLFFKAKTPEGLIEFQGHARVGALAGLFSDDRGRTREIALPSAPAPPHGCSDGAPR